MANDIIDIVVTDNSDNVQLNVTPNLVSINVSQTSGNIIGSNYYLASTYGALPVTGDTTTLYVINDTSLMYRWSGSAYVQINSSAVVAWGQITGALSSQTDLTNALNAKAPLASPTFTGTVSGITKAMVGLSNVDNTTDANKPISSATQTALDTKAPLASPTFTGTVSGITKSMVGLGNVDNTTDLLKPISTATQSALNLKYDASNPSGYISGITSGQITTALGYTPENSANKGIANGYASLDGGGLVPSTQLPSYVDDVLEYTNLAGFPASGTTGKIYVALDTNKIYRWSGTTYIEVSPTVGTIWGGITGTLSNQTDLQNALNLKYNTPTGDTTQYVAGDGSLITFPVLASADKLILVVRNTSGATITKGTVVYINGASGNKPTIAKALATGDATSAQTLGLVQANIANNSNGNVVLVGSVIDLDTSAFTEGQQLYLSGVTAGTYTATKTLAPTHLVYVGVITRAHPTQGVIEVKIQNGYELDEIHDVSIISEANNEGLFYESSTNLWKNKSISTVLGYTPSNDSLVVHLAGTETITGQKTFNPSVTAASAIARGTYLTPTLVASANSDVLVGLDINPTFTNGAFTGVSRLGLRLQNIVQFGISQYGSAEIKNLAGNGNTDFIGGSANTGSVNFYGGPSFSDGAGISITGNSNSNPSSIIFYKNGFFAVGRFFASGNLTLQNGGTFTDAGYRLDVTGTSRLNGQTTLTGSVTASSALAQGIIATPTLVASANSDTLVGLDINPTFTNGSFTGVSNVALRVKGDISPLTSAGSSLGSPSFNFSQGHIRQFLASGTGGFEFYPSYTTKSAQWFSTGNLTLQNGGTFTDAGFRLDVAGTTRFQGTTASDTAPLGSELAGVTGTGTNWALAGGATNLNVGGYVHTVGSVVPLTTSLAAVNGTYYQITYTITGRTAGSITIAYGGTSTNTSATGNTGPLASSTSALTITPTTDFNGTVVLSIKSIGTSSASSTFANSSGTSNIEIRASSVLGNTFIGASAGLRNTTGIQNTFLGSNSGIRNTTGLYNSFFGDSAGYSNTIGFNNSFFGMSAGYNNTGGTQNTFIGTSSGLNNTTGSNNTFVGQGAGQNNTTGVQNTFIGQGAGNINTTGGSNTFIGQAAGGANTVGSSNQFFGINAGLNNTTGGENTAVGSAAGLNNSTGNNNVFLGRNAGRYISDGTTSNTITDNSIYIGHTTKALANNQTNQIVIGNSSTGLGSNTTVLGNSSTVTTAIYGNLLLGTTTDAGFRLDVNGTARVSGAATFLSSVSATSYNATTQNIFAVDGTERMRIASDGTKYFGTFNTSRLQINPTGENVYSYTNNYYIWGLFNDSNNLSIESAFAGNIIFRAQAQGTSSSPTTAAERMRITSAGNVGIGVSVPAELLHVSKSGSGAVLLVEAVSGNDASLKLKDQTRSYYLGSSGGNYYIYDQNAAANRLLISSSGVVTITNLGSGAVTATSGVLSTTSDMTLKVSDGFIDNALEKISQLKPRYFYWKEESGLPTDIRQLGFYAQEVNQALGEEAANTPKNENDKWGIYDRGIIAMLTKAVQELSAEITILKNK
jgi:hypothetical protein